MAGGISLRTGYLLSILLTTIGIAAMAIGIILIVSITQSKTVLELQSWRPYGGGIAESESFKFEVVPGEPRDILLQSVDAPSYLDFNLSASSATYPSVYLLYYNGYTDQWELEWSWWSPQTAWEEPHYDIPLDRAGLWKIQVDQQNPAHPVNYTISYTLKHLREALVTTTERPYELYGLTLVVSGVEILIGGIVIHYVARSSRPNQ